MTDKTNVEYIFDKIVEKNLNEEKKVKDVHIQCCEECKYFDYVSKKDLPTVFFCTFHENPKESVNWHKLYNECPIGHHLRMETVCIKRYGIIHSKFNEYYHEHLGSISIVDFKETTFEWDGYNPDVCYDYVAVFYYNSDDEKLKMMEFAVDLYKRLNVDDEYTVKKCYG